MGFCSRSLVFVDIISLYTYIYVCQAVDYQLDLYVSSCIYIYTCIKSAPYKKKLSLPLANPRDEGKWQELDELGENRILI